jgi:hypothetical protein
MRSWFEDIRPDLLLDGLIEEEATFKDLWALFLKSKPSADPDDFEDFAVSYATGTNTDTEHKQAMDNIGAVRLATPKIHRELMALPHIAGWTPVAGASMVISYSCFGMDEETGELANTVTACDNVTGKIRSTEIVMGKPNRFDLEKMVYLSCAHPLPGYHMDPCRPTVLLLAFRWGKDVFEYIYPKLEVLGIHTVLETWEAAEKCARENGNDPMGTNFVKPSERGQHPQSSTQAHKEKNTKKKGGNRRGKKK